MLALFAKSRQRSYEEVVAEFKKDCAEAKPLWQKRVTEALAEEAIRVAEAKRAAETEGAETEDDDAKPLTRREVEERIAQNAVEDFTRLEAERESMQTRTNLIFGASAVMFAVLAVWPDTAKSFGVRAGMLLMGLGLVLAGSAFCMTILSTRPKFRRAWGVPYDNRFHRNLLAVTDFQRYVLYSWFGERLAPVVTTYKKTHAVAIPLLYAAVAAMIPGVALSVIFR